MVRSRYARGAVEVRSRCGRAVEVRSWYGPSTVEVRSWCASGSVRFVNFSTGDTVHLAYSIYIIFGLFLPRKRPNLSL